jgi:hypothetical protein
MNKVQSAIIDVENKIASIPWGATIVDVYADRGFIYVVFVGDSNRDKEIRSFLITSIESNIDENKAYKYIGRVELGDAWNGEWTRYVFEEVTR